MANDRPNIVLIITDQQRFDTIAALGCPWMDTPNLDRLVNEGVVFSNVFVNAPVCGPARSALFSGMTPHNTGVLRNDSIWRECWVEDLAASGYHCVNIGKMHTGPYDAPAGFHERYVVENKDRFHAPLKFFDELDKAILAHDLEKPGRHTYRAQVPDYAERLGAFEWPLPKHLHPDEFVGDSVVRWLDTSAASRPLPQPLFLEIGFPGPHPPFDPLAEVAEKYMQREFPMLEVTEAEMAAQPEGLKRLRTFFEQYDIDAVVHDSRASTERRQRQRAYYMANCEMIDTKVGQILEGLERHELLENSIVIFTSDHGESLGDHGMNAKWNMYDCVTRVPTIVWAPRRFAGGRTVADLYSWFDLGPTVLELAGLQTPGHYEAISMLPELEGQAGAAGREEVFSELSRDTVMNAIEYQIMLRTPDFKCVEFLGEDRGLLFDLNSDPDELVNLWDDPDQAERRDRMLARIHRWYVGSVAASARRNVQYSIGDFIRHRFGEETDDDR